MSAAGSSNPEYVVARVRARRGKLYGGEEYRKLTRMTPSEIARFMEESTYEAAINALGSRHSGVDLIEYALNKDLAEQFEAILDWSEGRIYDLVVRYLRKFDAWNVKTIIRGIYTDASQEEVEVDLIRAGEFDDRRIRRLLEADSVEAVVEILEDTIYGDALDAALPEYEESGVLVPLENAVDRAFYERLLDNLPGGEPIRQYREFLQAEIDFRNARNALRLARSGAEIDPAEYYIEGGELFSRSDLSRLANNVDELVTYLEESKYGGEIGDALAELRDAESLIAFEHATETALLEYADKLGTIHPTSVTPVISYILAKEREVENIRAIARGKEAGLSDEQIEEELVIQ
ncbi:V-type ATP synthase subunit C [Haloparvum sp. PAK95]|uniref:V-type ATP synthase subunit C n=1 Tax=Haloparvum sp. PAK95 TaxID=3418962 RepID=UPI003D2F0EDB